MPFEIPHVTDVAHEPACIEQLGARVHDLAGDVARLEAKRRFLLSPRETVELETRISAKRRALEQAQTEFDELAASLDRAREEERAARDTAARAARPQLLRRRRQLEKDLEAQLLEIERIAPDLVAAVTAALTVDAELRDVEHSLGERASGSSPSGWPLAIRNRLGFILCGDTSPLEQLDRPLGGHGQEPLTVPALAPSCTVCRHRHRSKLETSPEPLRELADRYGVSRAAISRHRRRHMPGG